MILSIVAAFFIIVIILSVISGATQFVSDINEGSRIEKRNNEEEDSREKFLREFEALPLEEKIVILKREKEEHDEIHQYDVGDGYEFYFHGYENLLKEHIEKERAERWSTEWGY